MMGAMVGLAFALVMAGLAAFRAIKALGVRVSAAEQAARQAVPAISEQAAWEAAVRKAMGMPSY